MSSYSGLADRVGGHGADECGVAHIEELISLYGAEVFEPSEKMILISIPKSYEEQEKSIYDAVRGTWKIDPKRASDFQLVLAHRKGLVVGAFEPLEWLPSTTVHFSWLPSDIPGRWGFIGREVEQSIAQKYIGKRVPDKYRRKGAANPVRFVEP